MLLSQKITVFWQPKIKKNKVCEWCLLDKYH